MEENSESAIAVGYDSDDVEIGEIFPTIQLCEESEVFDLESDAKGIVTRKKKDDSQVKSSDGIGIYLNGDLRQQEHLGFMDATTMTSSKG